VTILVVANTVPVHFAEGERSELRRLLKDGTEKVHGGYWLITFVVGVSNNGRLNDLSYFYLVYSDWSNEPHGLIIYFLTQLLKRHG